MLATLNHALSLLSSSFGVTVESHPPSAFWLMDAAVKATMSSTSSTVRRCTLITAAATDAAASSADSTAYQRRVKRTSSIGQSTNAHTDGDIAAAVIAAIFDSGTCCSASTWGSVMAIKPPLMPKVRLVIPFSQTGRVARIGHDSKTGRPEGPPVSLHSILYTLLYFATSSALAPALRAAALSVASQVKVSPVRPKWP